VIDESSETIRVIHQRNRAFQLITACAWKRPKEREASTKTTRRMTWEAELHRQNDAKSPKSDTGKATST